MYLSKWVEKEKALLIEVCWVSVGRGYFSSVLQNHRRKLKKYKGKHLEYYYITTLPVIIINF